MMMMSYGATIFLWIAATCFADDSSASVPDLDRVMNILENLQLIDYDSEMSESESDASDENNQVPVGVGENDVHIITDSEESSSSSSNDRIPIVTDSDASYDNIVDPHGVLPELTQVDDLTYSFNEDYEYANFMRITGGIKCYTSITW
ncbi:MAG: hypothetical protein AB8B56_10685 [Crocinitomicaceae bacterium]